MSKRCSEPASVKFSIALYRLLLGTYPKPFRLEYGEWMAQVFRDSCLSANRQKNAGAMLSLWASTVLDYFQSVMEQYANRGIEMTLSKWIKLSGWGLVASGLTLLLGWVASSRPEYHPYNAASWPVDRFLNAAVTPLLSLGVILAGAGMLGVFARFNGQVRILGRMGLSLGIFGSVSAEVGLIGLGVLDSGPWWEIAMFGLTGLFAGLVLFGVDCVRMKLFSRWNLLPLLTAFPWLCSFWRAWFG